MYDVSVYLVFDHGAEVVIPEEDTELSLLHGGRELTQAVVRELSGRAVQKLLRHDACGGGGREEEETHTGTPEKERL